MSEPDPNKDSSQQQKESHPKSGLSPGAKLALAAAFIAAASSPFINQHNWNKFKGEIGSRLTDVEVPVSKYKRSASIERLGGMD